MNMIVSETRITKVERASAELLAGLQGLAEQGELHLVADASIQDLMAALIKLYVVKVTERDNPSDPVPALFRPDAGVTCTDAVIVGEQLLKAGDVDIFELEMWRVLGKY